MGKGSKRRNEDIKKVWNNFDKIAWNHNQEEIESLTDQMQRQNQALNISEYTSTQGREKQK